ncbi:outer membrane beta-barrel protein [Candidatus Ulvibacter alkanivorans]|uniref:outer membrane beta-barrel protein n=1 Tax=Candidatus Ulvibacter alkanivorans TaxID=2267620 RepID=UPI000DF4866C|nr:outer membrane beta-barrel family protein [Candidatus Ulvibacter alkanivorans]
MSKSCLLFFLLLTATIAYAQDYTITGTVVDSNNKPLSFVTVLAFENDQTEAVKGTSTDKAGDFTLSGLSATTHQLTFSFIGFETKTMTLAIDSDIRLDEILLVEQTENLSETLVTARKPLIKMEAGKLVFELENTSLSTGNTFDLLKKLPGVLVVGESISIKSTTPVIYINNKRVYLSMTEVISLLQNVDASVIRSVEVITNPSAQYDAEAATVLNIITTRAISVGYKGSVSGRYEQAIFPKYNIATSHFYKNDWLNFYGSYSFSPRKEFKEDDNFVRFFQPDEVSTKSIWESRFTRTTRSYAHQGNIIADITVSEKSSVSFSVNALVSPNKTYHNTVDATIFNAQRQLDSTFTTLSDLENDTSNLSFNTEYQQQLGEKGATMTLSGNYIRYDEDQMQAVATNYFLPNGSFLRSNSFFTQAIQRTNIFTGMADFELPLSSWNLQSGLKYSNIDTESGLDFFDTDGGTIQFNAALSDLFLYEESIFAAYATLAKDWEQWNLEIGLRGEYTDVNGDSQSLGIVNTQSYFELFPSASIAYNVSENNAFGISYARKIDRPRYQSLNPFRYFINENNFNGGNPNLMPSIDNKITLSYSYKNKLFIEGYYQEADKPLSILTFQDNENSTLRNIDVNLIRDFQYSLDIIYAASLTPWWYASVVTSTFYLENEFFSVESAQETFSNNTLGFFAQMYSGLTLSSEAGITSDVTLFYLSDYITGSYDMENQFNLSVSFRKELWNNRASISVGVDDIFDTNNIPVVSRYYNQDNRYFAQAESRLFRVGFRYNFGNALLRDNNRSESTDEGERLQKN